jgi:hypothetical protein
MDRSGVEHVHYLRDHSENRQNKCRTNQSRHITAERGERSANLFCRPRLARSRAFSFFSPLINFRDHTSHDDLGFFTRCWLFRPSLVCFLSTPLATLRFCILSRGWSWLSYVKRTTRHGWYFGHLGSLSIKYLGDTTSVFLRLLDNV